MSKLGFHKSWALTCSVHCSGNGSSRAPCVGCKYLPGVLCAWGTTGWHRRAPVCRCEMKQATLLSGVLWMTSQSPPHLCCLLYFPRVAPAQQTATSAWTLTLKKYPYYLQAPKLPLSSHTAGHRLAGSTAHCPYHQVLCAFWWDVLPVRSRGIQFLGQPQLALLWRAGMCSAQFSPSFMDFCLFYFCRLI